MLFAFAGGKPLVGRNDSAVADFRKTVLRLEGPVAINDQPAVALQGQRRVDQGRQAARETFGADVISNVALHFGGGNPKIAQSRGNGTPCVFAGKPERRAADGIDDFHRVGIVARKKCGLPLCAL